MNQQQYIDQEVERASLKLKEQFDDQIIQLAQGQIKIIEEIKILRQERSDLIKLFRRYLKDLSEL